MAFIDVTNQATLSTALNTTAQPGDVIRMAPGNYGDIICNRSFVPKIIVMSRDLDHSAVINTLTMNGAQKITFEKVMFSYKAAASAPNFTRGCDLNNCTDLTFNYCKHYGSLDTNGFGSGYAVWVDFGTRVKFQGCNFYSWNTGVLFSRSTDNSMLYSEFTDIGNDGLRLSSLTGCLVQGNYFHDFRCDGPADNHSDYIQLTGAAGETTNSNITIEYNSMVIGAGSWTQGFIMRNEKWEAQQIAGNLYQNVIVRNNYFKMCFQNALQLGQCNGAIVDSNVFLYTAMVASEPYNAFTLGGGVHQGITSAQAVPRVFLFASSTGSLQFTNNKFHDASFYALQRWDIAGGVWTVSGNTTDTSSATNPTQPVFVLGNGAPLESGGAPLGIVKTMASRLLRGNGRTIKRGQI